MCSGVGFSFSQIVDPSHVTRWSISFHREMISTLFHRGTMENYNMTGDDEPRSWEILAGIIFHGAVLCWVIVFTGVQTAGVYSQGRL